MNGNIVMDNTAKTAMANDTENKVSIEKKNTFNQAAPADYEWVANEE
jgi:hypothetical protein